MKIAFFADSYKPFLSGVTIHIETLANELRRLGHRVYIFAPAYPNQLDLDPDLYRFPSIAGGYPKFRLALPFLRTFPEVDLIHTHSPFQAGLLARFLARRKEIPLLYTFHTLFTRYVHYAKFVPKGLAKIGITLYLQAFCRGVDRIIVPTTLSQRVLRRWGLTTSVEIIPSGVDLSLFPPEPTLARKRLRKKYRLSEEDRVLIYVGRLSKEKNISFLLQTFEKLKEDKVYLVLVGGGPLEKEIKKIQIKNLILTGEIPYPKVLEYYFMGDLFVFSSLTETQGLVLIEAKAAGLPVVALYAGGLIDAVRSGIDGYLLPRNPNCFVEHLKRLLNDRALREKMARAAWEDVRERFSSLLVAKKIESVYNSLVDKGGSR